MFFRLRRFFAPTFVAEFEHFFSTIGEHIDSIVFTWSFFPHKIRNKPWKVISENMGDKDEAANNF